MPSKVKCANPTCNTVIRNRRNERGREATSGLCRECWATSPAGLGEPPMPIADQVAADRQRTTDKQAESGLKLKYQHALQTIDTLEAQIGALDYLRDNTEPIQVVEHFGAGTSEACPLLVASDWHCGEVIGDEIDGNLNRHDPDVAKVRAETFFQAGLRLVRLLNQDVKIRQVTLALLGDFINNELHGAASAEKNSMQPTHELVFAQNLLIGGIEFLLNHSDYELVIPCHSGNHGRFTDKTRFSAENGHSLEYLMYLHLAAYFRNEPRVKFLIASGYHSYLPIYNQTVRFHHGHGLRYLGGVGGLTIPANKAIDKWNQGVWADLDVFGHYHTLFDGRNFLSNGSQVGYNAYAAYVIKAPYQPPMQWLTLFDKKRGRTCSWPIMFGQ